MIEITSAMCALGIHNFDQKETGKALNEQS